MVERTRVAQLITELRPAGAERVVYEIANGLDRERFDVRVFSLTSPGGDAGAMATLLERVGIPVVPVQMRNKLDVFGVRRLVRAMREFEPHVLHAHLFHANLAARLFGRRAGARCIISTIHVVERRPLRLRKILERLGARRDDRTVCVSAAVARYATNELGVVAPIVIHNGVDLERFCDLPDQASARRALGLRPAGGPVIGCLGRLTEQKGLRDLLHAFASMRADGWTGLLVIAGEGEQEQELRELARELQIESRMQFIGFQDAGVVLAALDVFCMPSLWEGFGLALVEALAVGLPVVASDVDSIPEVLGAAGILTPPGDPTALAKALRSLCADPTRMQDFSLRARRRAAEFGVAKMVQAYGELYDELSAAARAVDSEP